MASMRVTLHFCAAMVAVLFFGVSCGESGPGATPPKARVERPNILLVLADDLGWADVGYQGSSFHLTPHIDALAERGLVFTNAYASSPVCSPTRFSLLTGQSPARHGMTKALNASLLGGVSGEAVAGPADKEWWEPVLQDHVPESDTTIAERLQGAGYRTGIIGKWHLGSPLPQQHGFDVSIATHELGGPGSYFSPYGIPGFPDGPEGEYITDRITEEAIGFMGQESEAPFFLVLSHFAPHSPWEAKEELIAQYAGRADPAAAQKNPIYAAMIESLDDSVGRLVAALDEAGLTENTLVVFTSDNGALTQRWLRRKSKHRTLFEITSNEPLRGGKGKLYEGGLRVPTIFYWPGVVEPGRCEVPTDTTDYYPTFLELCGLKSEGEPLDGVSLMPLLNGEGEIDREALYFHFPHQTLVCAMRRGDEKLVHHFGGPTELYDLARDPGEARDLSEKESARALQLKEELLAWLESVGAHFPVRNPDYQ